MLPMPPPLEPSRPPSPIGKAALGVANLIEGSEERRAYDERAGVHSKHYLTMIDPRDTDWIIGRVRDQVAGKVVVEIGAGAGVLALELARHARHVYAIEVDPAWSWVFARHLYAAKPGNLTWIFDRAENLVDILRTDVAIVVTCSDELGLWQLAGRFAPTVIMPWQDWNGGRAVVGWSEFGGDLGPPCRCQFGCVMDGAHGMKLGPRERCQLRDIGAVRAEATP